MEGVRSGFHWEIKYLGFFAMVASLWEPSLMMWQPLECRYISWNIIETYVGAGFWNISFPDASGRGILKWGTSAYTGNPLFFSLLAFILGILLGSVSYIDYEMEWWPLRNGVYSRRIVGKMYFFSIPTSVAQWVQKEGFKSGGWDLNPPNDKNIQPS